MKKQNSGFTLIELMIVVAIIGILASLAISSYQTYTVRAQISEALLFGDGAKNPVVDAYNNDGVPPADRGAAGMTPLATDTQGNYVSAVGITIGRIDITLGNNAHADIFGRILSITPYQSGNGSIQWRCGHAPAPGGGSVEMTGGGFTTSHQVTTIDQRYLPATCRQ